MNVNVNVNDGTGWCRGESESETEEQTLPIPQHDTSPSTGHSILASAVDFLPFLATLVNSKATQKYSNYTVRELAWAWAPTSDKTGLGGRLGSKSMRLDEFSFNLWKGIRMVASSLPGPVVHSTESHPPSDYCLLHLSQITVCCPELCTELPLHMPDGICSK